MKLLFVLENLAERCGPNVPVIIDMLQFSPVKHESYAIADNIDSPVDAGKIALFSSVTLNKFDNYDYFSSNHADWSTLTDVQKVFLLLLNPGTAVEFIKMKWQNKNKIRVLARQIEKISLQHEIDAVVGIIEPFGIAKAIAKSNTKAKKILLQMDPYTYNFCYRKSTTGNRKRTEDRVRAKMDKMMILDFVYDDMVKRSQIKPSPKFIRCCYPRIKLYEETDVLPKSLAEEGKVHFAFLGRFYRDIRNPRFLLELFRQLPENYILDIFGGGVDDVVDEYREVLGNRLRCHGFVSNQDANAFSYGADILVNLNNTITNQMPSKLIGYFCTGKPIVNIYFSDECPSLNYTNKYPNCINVKAGSVSPEQIAEIVKFIEKSRDTLIDKNYVTDVFYEATDVYFAQLFEAVLQGNNADLSVQYRG